MEPPPNTHAPGAPRWRRRNTAVFAMALLSACAAHPAKTVPGRHAAATRQIALALGETSVGGTPRTQPLPAYPAALLPSKLPPQTLQARLADDGGTPQHYDLAVSFGIVSDVIGIQANNLATRVRLIGSANYVLTSRTMPPTRVTSGSARFVDAYNLFDQQFFAGDLEDESVRRRIAEALAEQITNQLAIFFRKRANG